MKFVNYLERITGVGIYPMISLLIFTALAVLVVIYVVHTSDETVNEMKNLPLDNDN
ncbi:MAG: CcoQ/FixQ family Cbb3-type cytochrome c oxidase assembly chaperone [Sphingobacteriales bacterium]|jgi:hypothetical protein|nr:CcoQ/FixQ family Cbb3-type cytochrome c oxidase assembly chaperone [Sphingobacteriales bacterium]